MECFFFVAFDDATAMLEVGVSGSLSLTPGGLFSSSSSPIFPHYRRELSFVLSSSRGRVFFGGEEVFFSRVMCCGEEREKRWVISPSPLLPAFSSSPGKKTEKE